MIQFPNAKINLGLRIIKKRSDGYHEIETCMYPIPWYDALEIIPSKKFNFQSTGLAINTNAENNLITKAYNLLKEAFNIPPVDVHLHKIIPMGAGLGGGSADAAIMLKLLNAEFELGISPKELKNYAAEIGSDCPFFIDNVPAICTGRGEIMEPIDFTLSGLKLLLVKPNIHISTAEAYANVIPKTPENNLRTIILNPQLLKEQLFNDFETPIFQQYPTLKEIKNELYKLGAIYASMSGSGSTMYGLFSDIDETKINFENCETKLLAL